ncbi:MAG: aminopeptidase [Ktedonobacteraceae bacterium]|nr:aminopeptidase [Ktedonobacteraceae bacterium]
MADIRHQKLAQVLINYSLKIQPGDKLLVTGSDVATPLLREVYREALRAGAHEVKISVTLPGISEILLHEGNNEQLTYVSEYDKFLVEHFDAVLSVWSDQNTRSMGKIDPKRIAKRREAHSALFKRDLELMSSGAKRWCGTLFPTHAYAQDAGMSLSDYEDFVFGSGLLDQEDPIAAWRKVSAEQQRVADFLTQHDEIHIVAPSTDITYRVGGRNWINCAGTENFPDGEIFSCPIEDSVNGFVTFSYPAIYDGNEVENVRLTFRDGKVIESSADRGLDFLNSMLDTDAGARYLGEVAFGLNYNIKEFVKETLFDEKIGGTMHMALGASLPEGGGVNESGIHWDMVCDLREGKVFADGQLCYEQGKFIIE